MTPEAIAAMHDGVAREMLSAPAVTDDGVDRCTADEVIEIFAAQGVPLTKRSVVTWVVAAKRIAQR